MAKRIAAYQDRHPRVSTADALAAVQRGEDRPVDRTDFAERVDLADPHSVARAAQSYQADQASRGVRIGTIEAVNHVRERAAGRGRR